MEIYNTWLAILAVACAATLGRWLRNGLKAALCSLRLRRSRQSRNPQQPSSHRFRIRKLLLRQHSPRRASKPPLPKTLLPRRGPRRRSGRRKSAGPSVASYGPRSAGRDNNKKELRAVEQKVREDTERGSAGENANASVSSVRFGMKVVSSLAAYTSSSVQTLKLTRMFGPKVWVIGTSAASRPWAIRTRPIRGMLLRASKVYQRPPI